MAGPSRLQRHQSTVQESDDAGLGVMVGIFSSIKITRRFGGLWKDHSGVGQGWFHCRRQEATQEKHLEDGH